MLVKQMKKNQKNKKGGFQSMLLGSIGADLLGNLLPAEGAKTIRKERGVIRAGEGAATTSRGWKSIREELGKFFNATTSSKNFVQRYYQCQPKLNGVVFISESTSLLKNHMQSR